MSFRSGFVTILGKPNAGKSTLLNALINEKVSIVSPKPQTTRNKILGILNGKDYQIIFIDTPGIHVSHNKLDEYMSKSIDSAKDSADVYLLVLDGTKKITDSDLDFIRSFKGRGQIIVVVTKTDLVKMDKLYPELAKLNNLDFVKDIYPISAIKGDNVKNLLDTIISLMPEGVRYFDEDIYTDKSTRFLVEETIREKALLLLQDEIPHGIACQVVEYKVEHGVTKISCDIICEKDSHKSIIIGKGGSMLKDIGTRSRRDIEKIVGGKVGLTLFVKVKSCWRDNSHYVEDFGYNKKDI